MPARMPKGSGKSLTSSESSIDYQHLTATQLVPRFWQEGRHFDMPELLAELVPQEGEDDLRGFEWHYWRRMTDDLRVIQAHAGTILTLALAPDGKLFATAGRRP